METGLICRNSLYYFIGKTFKTLNPNVNYLPNWHIMQIARKLEAAATGEIKRLIINMPPRYLKSICTSVAFPAWLLGNNPTQRIIVASHNSDLSLKLSLDTRKIMQTDWYQKFFPKVQLSDDQNEKGKFMSSNFGFRIATSIGAGITGEGGNFLILDDPQTPEQAFCERSRTQCINWFEQTFSTRLDDKKNGVIILVSQRLHQDDLSGTLLKHGGWEHLCLPIVDNQNRLLHEAREGWPEVSRLKNELGEYTFASQYMQKPYLLDGGIIKRGWLKFFDEMPDLKIGQIYQSWDTAIKTGANSDYSVCLTILETSNGYYLIDIMREKLIYPDLKRKFLSLAEIWKPAAILVEDKASGQSLIQDLRVETTLPIIPQMPKLDKFNRLASVSPIIEAGKIFLHKNNPLSELFEAELISFPNSKNDDLVDALSQALLWIKNKNSNIANIRRI